MDDNKFSRRGFLKMLGFGGAAVVMPMPDFPTSPIKDNPVTPPAADIVVTARNVTKSFQAGKTGVYAGTIVALDADGSVIHCEPQNTSVVYWGNGYPKFEPPASITSGQYKR